MTQKKRRKTDLNPMYPTNPELSQNTLREIKCLDDRLRDML